MSESFLSLLRCPLCGARYSQAGPEMLRCLCCEAEAPLSGRVLDLRAPGEPALPGVEPRRDLYAAALPFLESWGALRRLSVWLSRHVPSGGIVLDASLGPLWTALELCAWLPGREVIALVRERPALPDGGLPERLSLVVVRPDRPLPFAPRSVDALVAHDALHARPELARQALRVARGPIVFPHVHARDPADPVGFARHGLTLSWEGWSRLLGRVARQDRRAPRIFAEAPLASAMEGAPVEALERPARNLLAVLAEPQALADLRVGEVLDEGSVQEGVLRSPFYRLEGLRVRVRSDEPDWGWLIARHPNATLLEERRLSPAQAALLHLAREPRSMVALAVAAGVSPEEARRDLGALARDGLLRILPLSAGALRLQQASEGGSSALPVGWRTLDRMWVEGVTSQPYTALLLISEERSRFSRAEVDGIVRRIAAWLLRAGQGPGGTLLLPGLAVPQTLFALWGAWLAGMRVAILDPDAPEGLVADLLERAQVTALTGEIAPGSTLPRLPWEPDALAELLPPPLQELTPRQEEQEALVLFTSGSLGAPRGVVLSDRAVVRATWNFVEISACNARDIWVTLIGPHTIAGLRALCLAPLASGGAASLLPPTRGVGALLAACEAAGASVLSTSPLLLGVLRRDLDRLRALRGSLRLLLCSGATLDPQLRREVGRGLGVSVRDAFGLTETGGAFMATLSDDEDGMSPVNALVRVVGPDGQEREPGEVGELVVFTEAALSRTLEGPGPLDRGWVRTGDLGSRRPDGRLLHLGRRDRQISLPSGVCVQPERVERTLSRLDGVQAAFVCVHEGRLVALVEGASEEAVETPSLREALRRELLPQEVPSRILLVHRIPRGAGGKIDTARAALLLGAGA